MKIWYNKTSLVVTVLTFFYSINPQEKKAVHKNVCGIRTGQSLSIHEKNFLTERSLLTNPLIRKLVGAHLPTKAIPRIAIASSGGGFRALIGLLGALSGLNDTNLLDTATYLAGISGSTWAIAGMNVTQKNPLDFLHYLETRLEKPLFGERGGSIIFSIILSKLFSGRYFSIPEIFGALIAEKLFEEQLSPQNTPFSLLSPELAKGTIPFPLCVAAIAHDSYEPLEINPYETTSPFLKTAIATSCLGQHFSCGKTSKESESLSLSNVLGILGSAMSANVGEIFSYINQQKPGTIDTSLINTPENEALRKTRILPALIPNWNHHTPYPYHQEEFLTVVDGGFLSNLPLSPLLTKERAVDIIIAFDFDNDAQEGKSLKTMAAYAKKHSLPFPQIDYTVINQPCSYHPGNAQTPTIIYFPFIKNDTYENGWKPNPKDPHSFTATTNFVYTPDQVQKLAGLMRHTVCSTSAQKMILDAIKTKAQEKAPHLFQETK